ncbi:SGNH/GDSL hydrolase family protein [Elongatibacter sediminis]|uniref:SGNH/GDSL hydrolase family protein n=1 Tax=Elongatibacter sediminis TaxID=3119006 RepID=A0AAW9RKT4_9GAMM
MNQARRNRSGVQSGRAARLLFWTSLPLAAIQGLGVRRRALQLPPPPGIGSGTARPEPGNAVAVVADSEPGDARPRATALRLLVVGDSIAAGIGATAWRGTLASCLAKALAATTGRSVEWAASGRSGDSVADLLLRVTGGVTAAGAEWWEESGAPPDVVLVSIGVNDVTGLTRLRHWSRAITELADRLRRRWPRAVIVFAGLPEMEHFPLPPQPLKYCLGLRARQLDRLLATAVSPRPGMLHVETRVDPENPAFCADGFHPSTEGYAAWAEALAQRLTPLMPSDDTRNRSIRS